MVTASQEARTVGVVYAVRDRKLYISTRATAWKARHIAANSHVSLTIPIAKRIPVMPWIKIPAATITTPELLSAILGPLAEDEKTVAETSVIEVTPVGEFITYGVGVSLRDMRQPELARGRAPVA